MKKGLFRKGLVIGIILFLIGVSLAPSINAYISKISLDDEIIEYTIEICGMNGGKQKVTLTQRETKEVESLFDSVTERLNKTETREEAEDIFEDAVLELDKYGLLGGLTVKQAQNLVTKGYQIIKNIDFLYKLLDINNNGLNWDGNRYCLIYGEVNEGCQFYSPFIKYGKFVDFFLAISLIRAIPWDLARNGISTVTPTFADIVFGLKIPRPDEDLLFPAQGFIWTIGTKGIREWNGSFFGQIADFSVKIGPVMSKVSYIGATWFLGIKILIPSNEDSHKTWLIGSAQQVYLDYRIPGFLVTC